jgi:chemotaxis protein MotB
MPRKPKHEEHENHERWLVSYADFITLLFAFFVVMYAISSVNEGKYRVLSDSLVSAFQKAPRSTLPIPLGKEVPSSAPASSNLIKHTLPVRKGDTAQNAQRKQQEIKMKSIAKDILQVLAPLVKGGQVSVTQSSRGIAVQINASVLFPPALANLEGESVKALIAVAKVIAPVDNAIQVEGYSDNSPISTTAYPSNWELSSARASSVVRLFVANGVAPERLVAMGYAENRSVDSNDTPEGRARNRRVTIMILSEAQEKITELPVAPASKTN